MKTKIHFACLFGVDYELDLMPYWVEHWASHHLDSYKVFLHRETGVIDSSIVDFFRKAGFSVECVGGPHSNGLLRGAALGNHAANLPPEDFLVTADADEYHLLNYHDILPGYDVVTGFLVDRYGMEMTACVKDPFEQYDHEEPFTREVIKNFTPPFLRSTQWPYTMRTKILACRAGNDSTYMGSHCMKSISSDARILKDQKVYHFAWRKSAAEKAVVKSYYKKENVKEIFGLNVPEEYLKQFSDLQDIHEMAVL